MNEPDRGTRVSWWGWAIVAVLIWGSLFGWAMASPVGSAPDDDFHLANIYCLHDSTTCRSDDAAWPAGIPWWPWYPEERVGPEWAAVQAAYPHLWQFGEPRDYPCYLLDEKNAFTPARPGITADCLSDSGSAQIRGNAPGSLDNLDYYPTLGYRFLSVFTGDSIQSSVQTWRFVMCVVAALVAVGSIALSLPPHRKALAVTWLVTSVPVGMFVLSSINPSAWPLLGTAAAVGPGVALTLQRRLDRIAGLRIAWLLLAAVMILGGRTEGPIFLLLTVAVVLILGRVTAKVLLVGAGVTVALLALTWLVGVGPVLFDRVVLNYLRGWQGHVWEGLMQLPTIFAFGGSRIGWTEILLPPTVTIVAVSCFAAVVAIGLGELDRRKAVAAGLVALVLAASYMAVWTRSGMGLQARYYLPALFLFCFAALAPISRVVGGLALREPNQRESAEDRATLDAVAESNRAGSWSTQRWSLGQWLVLGVGLVWANAVAVSEVTARYVSGTRPDFGTSDPTQLSTVVTPSWWWQAWLGPFPNAVFASACFAGLVSLVVWFFRREESRNQRLLNSTYVSQL